MTDHAAARRAQECVMDFPTAWAFTIASEDAEHDPRCSWIQARLLCDCRVIWNEYEQRHNEH